MNQIKNTLASKQLSNADYQRAAKLLGIEVATIKAVVKVEASGHGFLADGRPKILFERHWFWKLTPLSVSKIRADLSNPKAGGYLGGTREWDRLNAAIQFDKLAALKSASWGLGQIMGFNYKVAGYEDVESFVEAMSHSEGKQLDAMMTFIKNHPRMVSALRSHDWSAFAKAYNGPAYRRNQYDTKLAQAFNYFKTKTIEPVPISPFNPGGLSPRYPKTNSGILVVTGKATIEFIKDSYLKRLPHQSSELIGDQKVPVITGKEFRTNWFKKEGDHVLFELESPVAGVLNWYAYTSHIQIKNSSAQNFLPIPVTPTTDSTQLSPHFKLWEFVVSETASRYHIDNTPQQKHIKHLRILCEEILEPAREALGPLRINSGYRSPALNKAIKGSPTSAHMQGYAADVNPLNVSKIEFAKWVKNNCKFDQIILEFGTPKEPAWIHVSCDPRGKRQVLRTVRGGGYVLAHL